MATKKQLARRLYDEELEYLTPGEKAAVTRAFNKQTSNSGRARSGPRPFTCHVGRFGNGLKGVVMEKGNTVADAIDRADMAIDEDKESVIAESTGNKVDLNDKVVKGENYLITPDIRSA